jgi:DNA polymerase III delta prime subunit
VQRVLERIKQVASAYIFTGPPDSAKLEDARAFAHKLGCAKIDLVEVGPDGATLKIDQVRALQQQVRYGPSAGPYQFVIVRDADKLTPDAAAAFLKTLEEPPPGVIFILLVERADRLPATIASRCQRIVFGEQPKKWEPRAEYADYYKALKSAGQMNVLELLELATGMGREKTEEEGVGGIETLLYDLAFYARQELNDIRMVRALLNGVKNLKKRANVKLALDNMCLQLGEA